MCGFRASPTSMWHTESCDCSGCCCHSNLNSNPNSYHHYNMQCNTSPKNSLVSNGGQRNADTVYENCNNTALLLYMSKYLQLCVKERETWRARLQVNQQFQFQYLYSKNRRKYRQLIRELSVHQNHSRYYEKEKIRATHKALGQNHTCPPYSFLLSCNVIILILSTKIMQFNYY